jgi:hypothetical protein
MLAMGRAEFETHLTLAARAAEALPTLAALAQARGLDLLHIVLDEGQAPSQPMLTRRGVGPLEAELQAARVEAAALRDAGFPVERIKIESTAIHRDVPLHDEEAAAGAYFEHHLLILVADEQAARALRVEARRHGGHLSRNALRTRTGGQQERFVTQRVHGAGRVRAERALAALLEGLRADGVEVLKVKQEYVVHDDNLALDAGWSGEPLP